MLSLTSLTFRADSPGGVFIHSEPWGCPTMVKPGLDDIQTSGSTCWFPLPYEFVAVHWAHGSPFLCRWKVSGNGSLIYSLETQAGHAFKSCLLSQYLSQESTNPLRKCNLSASDDVHSKNGELRWWSPGSSVIECHSWIWLNMIKPTSRWNIHVQYPAVWSMHFWMQRITLKRNYGSYLPGFIMIYDLS